MTKGRGFKVSSAMRRPFAVPALAVWQYNTNLSWELKSTPWVFIVQVLLLGGEVVRHKRGTIAVFTHEALPHVFLDCLMCAMFA